MKHQFSTLILMFCLLMPLAADTPAISNRAIKDIATQSYTRHTKATVLNNTEHKKQKRIARQERLKQRFEKRKINHQQRQQKLQALHKHTGAHRTSADYQENLRTLSRSKHAHHRDHEAQRSQKKEFTTKQEGIAQSKQDQHKAARDALKNMR